MARYVTLPDGSRLDLDQEIDGHLLDRTRHDAPVWRNHRG